MDMTRALIPLQLQRYEQNLLMIRDRSLASALLLGPEPH